ncbi:lipase family protein [Streptomyces sp. NPDC020403]|uniref:alpha/beta hydrolase family protein n=1 Tax=unclassified Streptomyces TaxID=2593676 RepID=UPI0033C7E03C
MRRKATAVLSLLALATAPVGCGLSTHTPPTPRTQPKPQAAPQPDHSEDTFYDYPDQARIDRAAPGEILKSQKIPTPPTSLLTSDVSQAQRIMYRTADEHDNPVAATGFLLLPKTPPKDPDGWPLISWAHGATGVGPQCAPSRTTNLGGMTPLMASWLRQGFAVVAADYPGLGPNGKLHAFVNLRAEGHSVAHAALAARNANRGAVSRKWFAVGLSQGGHAALGAGEQAAEAEDMHFLGTAAFAPAAHQTASLRNAVDKQNRGLSLEGFRGLLAYTAVSAHVYNPKKFPYDDMLSPGFAKEIAEPAVHNLCLDEIDEYLTLFAPEKKTSTLNPNWETKNPALKKLLDSMNPAQRRSSGPILVLQGEDDKVVLPESTTQLITELCAKKDSVDWKSYPGVDHLGVATAGQHDLITWMNNRLEDTRPTNRCRPSETNPTQGK